MNDSLNIFRKTPAESYAAGYGDSKRFIAMYRAYLAGASAAADEEGRERLILRLSMMGLIFAGWALLMILVFKN